MAFTSLDKALTDRAIRYMLEQAARLKAEVAPAGVWPKTEEGRRAKRLFDIYGRDAADLKSLQARLIRDHADPDLVLQMAKRRKAKKVPLAGEANGGEKPGEQIAAPPAKYALDPAHSVNEDAGGHFS